MRTMFEKKLPSLLDKSKGVPTALETEPPTGSSPIPGKVCGLLD